MSERADHQSVLFYTLNDDGIWVGCSCGAEVNIGHRPSLVEAQLAWEEHIDA